jgi:hypothetical protein
LSAFKDHFSSASDRYAAYRPDYPGGVIALWGYGRMVLPGEMDVPFERFLPKPSAHTGRPSAR